MGSQTTETSIANRALQLLGYKPIGSLNDNDRGARAIRRAYQPRLEALLRGNYWGFAMTRQILAASTTAPKFGNLNYFPLPGDCVMIGPPDQFLAVSGYTYIGNSGNPRQGGITDWKEEMMPGGGKAIVSNDRGPIYIRYVSNAVQPGQFDPSFAEALACDLAMNTCEELTQSNTKLTNIETLFKAAMDDAKKRNAFEVPPVAPPVDPWILARF